MQVKSMLNIVQKQKDFFNSNKTKDVPFRVFQLKKLYSLVKSNEQFLYDSIYKDFNKSEFDTYTNELALVYLEIEEAIKKTKQWSKRKRVRTNLVNFPARSYIIPEPLGTALIIGAWNYPYQLLLIPLVSAVAAGCTIILKPSELPINTSNAIAKIINKNFAEEYIKVVEGGVDETTELLNQKFDKIFFTGSNSIAKIVYKAAAKNLTPVTLELGGKSPTIVMSDCNLSMTVKRLVWAKFLNAGQTCIAPDYVCIEKSIKEKFIVALIEEIKNSNFGLNNQNYCSIINPNNVQRLAKLIDVSKVIYGGEIDYENLLVTPTVMNNITFNDNVMKDEIFGPILPIIEFENLDNIISEIKSRPKPLSAYVFTSNNKTKAKILSEISFGGGCINDAVMHISNGNLPFGGVGNSGIGNYHGKKGFDAFSHYKSILDKPTWFETPLKYFPRTNLKLKTIKRMMGLK